MSKELKTGDLVKTPYTEDKIYRILTMDVDDYITIEEQDNYKYETLVFHKIHLIPFDPLRKATSDLTQQLEEFKHKDIIAETIVEINDETDTADYFVLDKHLEKVLNRLVDKLKK